MATLENQWSTTGVVAAEVVASRDDLTNDGYVDQVPRAALGRVLA